MQKHWRPEQSASFWVSRVARALLRRQDEALEPLGFSMSQMPVLGALVREGPLKQAQLARAARVEQPTMAEALRRMERLGVVTRKPDPKDGRSDLVSLTARARRRLDRGRAALASVERRATAGLTAAQRRQLVALLQQVAEA